MGRAEGRALRAHRPAIEAFHSDGTVEFAGGGRLQLDAVIFCTGFLYDIPFVQIPDFVPPVTRPAEAGTSCSCARIEDDSTHTPSPTRSPAHQQAEMDGARTAGQLKRRCS